MRRITLLLLSLGLTGCAGYDALTQGVSGLTDYFLGGEDNSDPPSALIEYTPEVTLEVVWKESTGVGTDGQTLKLVPAVGFGKILAADRDGMVQCRDIGTGRLVWEAETETPISGGPGVGSTAVVVGSSDAEVVALRLENGTVLWKSKVSSEVLSVPVIAKGIVLIRTTDGAITALDEKNGGQLWRYEHNVPPLSIRGTSAPIIVSDNVIDGYDNGKLLALQLQDGKYVWEASIAIPKGRSEVERLVDLDADPIETGGVIFIAGYRGGIGAVSAPDGDVLWRNEDISSYSGLSNDFRYLYLTDTESHVLQVDQRTGRPLWKQKELHQRKLTAPIVYENYVVAGDLEGYVHWLSNSDGKQLGRVQVTDEAIEAKPVVVDNTVFVYAKDGTLAALKVRSH
ncbi:MAG: outer membrane protein assembly factor BamB [Methylococcaceae bacterium]|nr:outer membrane protein assembly factor BamB [Methylococcaceae bacterium]